MQSPFTKKGGVLELKPGQMKYFVCKYLGGNGAGFSYEAGYSG